MKIILLRATKKNAFLMVGGKIEGLSNLTVPNEMGLMTCFSRENFGKTTLNAGNYPGELFIQYAIGFETKEIKIIKQPSHNQFTKQKCVYINDKDIWTPSLKELNNGWILPVKGV